MKRALIWALGLTATLSFLPNQTSVIAAPSPFGTAGVVIAATQSTPELYINSSHFDGPFDPSWAITVINADPNSDVVLEEYRWNGVGWDQTWNGVVTTTNSFGNAYWNHFGPDRNGFYYAQVRVNGTLSNPVSYTVG
jgi:hypothetical protein